MKLFCYAFLFASTLPLHIFGALLRFLDSVPAVPKVVCDPLAGGAKDSQLAFDESYLKGYIESVIANHSQAGGGVLEQFGKADLDGNGVLDCSELLLIRKELNVKDTGVKHTDVFAQQPGFAPSPAGWQSIPPPAGTPVGWQSNPANPNACKPKCTWKCISPTCDAVCRPKCASSPQCQTRCTGVEMQGCQMTCGQPNCRSICAPAPCETKDCPACVTQCSKPMCKLDCPVGAQNCRDVCEVPTCEWVCRKPACPKPKCELFCDSPTQCHAAGYRELPPLTPGETIVKSFVMPDSTSFGTATSAPFGASFAQHGAPAFTMPVPITKVVAVAGSSELKIERSSVRLPVVIDT